MSCLEKLHRMLSLLPNSRHIVWSDIWQSADLIYAAVLTLAISLILGFFPQNPYNYSFLDNLIQTYLAVGGGLFAIIIAAFSIFASWTEPRFLLYLEEKRALNSYLTSFYMTALAAVMAVLTSLITHAIYLSTRIWPIEIWLKLVFHAIPMFFLLYALFGSMIVIDVIMGLMTFRSAFYKKYGVDGNKEQSPGQAEP